MRGTLTAKLSNLWPSFTDRIGLWSVGFCGGRKLGEPEENPSAQGREPTTNSTHLWRRVQESNPGHRGGRRTLSPLRHPGTPKYHSSWTGMSAHSFSGSASASGHICGCWAQHRNMAGLSAIQLLLWCLPDSPASKARPNAPNNSAKHNATLLTGSC